ncbi:ribonuclease H-like domain-containing protein [Luteibacter yeojuensis]|uniref:Ribonuclease H-like domain-containing protein n=2 Tax=Luteibacter yeojuensis TaxID=345309 RepID=A0A7X5QSY4_9GAMM|nr:ribonuclease H-like domain-containing protein [Luteibacter yeojuensis]
MAGVRERIAQPRSLQRPHTREVPGEEIAPGLRYIEHRFAWGEPPAELDLAFARLTTARREHLLHFDTETTGLAGGTGTRAFMIGAADWYEGALRVRQLYITAMAAESAMLRAFTGWIGTDTVLVSYNGKSYDAPLLATRYRLARLENPLKGLRHVDLLHPMRRRYRGVWENCRMQTAERQLLRVVREDDLPGSEAPRAWLTYLRGGSSANLARVAEHNLQDVRSLSGLLVHAHGWAASDVRHASPAGNEK